ncbi:MAG: nuclear transport factor 2 family protein [Terracidiphilus sp.]|jgi:ketosteroid isomerase-like protein
MKCKTMFAVWMTSLSLLFFAGTLAAQDKVSSAPSDAKATIRATVDRYMQSIDDADIKLGATVWSPTPDVTFINPLGHEHGWDEIASEVYGKLMGQTFTRRTLKNVGDVNIRVYGDAAVVEFDWDFVAIMRSDGSTIHTTGRESQTYVNLPGSGWKLVHVHYSGPAVSGPGKGF